MSRANKGSFYYLMRDVLSCFPNTFEENFLGTINHHYIAKQATRRILKDEIKEKKPNFHILAGCLILQNVFLRQMPQVAFYEVADVLPALNYCFREDTRKTIKRISSEVILRLFITIYFEFILLPLKREEGKKYIEKFKKFFSKEDVWKIMQLAPYRTHIIMERQGFNIGYNGQMDKKLLEILGEFY